MKTWIVGSLLGVLVMAFPRGAAGAPPATSAVGGDRIPVELTGSRVEYHGTSSASVLLGLKNVGPGKLIGWWIAVVLVYPDGHTRRTVVGTHCHTADSARLVDECEIPIAETREERTSAPLREGQLPQVTSARVETAVFETDVDLPELWFGDRQPLDALLATRAERRRAWKEVLRVLEACPSSAPENRIQVAHDCLARGAPQLALTKSALVHLERAEARRAQGHASDLDLVEILIRTARFASSDRKPHERKE